MIQHSLGSYRQKHILMEHNRIRTSRKSNYNHYQPVDFYKN